MIQNIPLNQLILSERNVRKTRGGGFKDLVASIAAIGLRQNLSVTKPLGAGPYLVEAGGRRLSALQELAKTGKLPADYPVPCLVVDQATAAEGSLAENVICQAMHPADEFDAFKALADEGKTSDEISERFGCEPRHVEQRLRLATVAPDILAEYREGKANLEQMQALALTDDHKAQRAVWAASSKHRWGREPARLRDAITEKEVASDDAVAQYVGIEAYEAAGGVARKDLFGDEVYFPDEKLLHKVALEKLQKTVDKVLKKESWKWGEARLVLAWGDEQKFGKAAPATGNKPDQFDPATRVTAGFIAHIAHGGRCEITRGLVRPEDRKEASQVAKSVGASIKGGEKAAAKTTKKPGEFSFAAHQRLQAEAAEIVKVRLCAMPDTAMALLAAELAHCVFGIGHGARGQVAPQWVHYQRDTTGRVHGPHIDAARGCEAGIVMRELEEQWREMLPAGRGALRDWCLDNAMRDTGLVPKLLAFLTARELQSVDLYAGNPTGDPCGLASACEVDLSHSWVVSEEWLATLPKSTILELVREANGRNGKKIADDLAKLKKDALPAAALPKFPAGWLPKPIRPKAARVLDAKQKAAGETADAED